MRVLDRASLERWEVFRAGLRKATYIKPETVGEKKARIKKLESNTEEWFEYYFPNYYSCKPAKFHIAATKRVVEHDNWYECRAWSRENAKSTRAMMEVIYMALTGMRKNVLMVSHTFDNACDLLMPFMINFEENQRIINDYGPQRNIGRWEIGKFVTANGVSFRAIGAGQSPRGTRNEEARPDVILIDDIDTDEKSRNAKRVEDTWKWIERALIPTLSISGKYTVLFLGNIIAKDCIILRAMKMADHFDVVNIRDKNGKSSWPEKNSEEAIDRILSKISYLSAQQEYYNNPVVEGTVFKELTYAKVPPLARFKFLVIYGDPAPSNKENKNNSYKAVVLMGRVNDVYYVINCRLDHATNQRFTDWYFELRKEILVEVPVYYYIENNTLQDPFYEQVYMPLFKEATKKHGINIYPIGDGRKKPDKFSRIEGNLEPLNRNGKLLFNEKEKDNPNMKRLIEQFEAVEPTLSAHVDGPDCVESGKFMIDSKTLASQPILLGQRQQGSYTNKKRF